MRTIKDLLELMLDHQELFYGGLCMWNEFLCKTHIINSIESLELQDYINNHRPSKYLSLETYKYRNVGYYWKCNNIKPRIKWLKKHIKKNS